MNGNFKIFKVIYLEENSEKKNFKKSFKTFIRGSQS